MRGIAIVLLAWLALSVPATLVIARALRPSGRLRCLRQAANGAAPPIMSIAVDRPPTAHVGSPLALHRESPR